MMHKGRPFVLVKSLFTGRWLILLSLGYAIVCFFLQISVLFPDVDWSGDISLNRLQADILLESRFRSLHVPIWENPCGKPETYFPFDKPFVTRSGDHYFVSYPLAFPSLLALFSMFCGTFGPFLLTSAAAGSLLYLTGRMAIHLGLPSSSSIWVVILTGIATPVVIYGNLVWGHILSAGLFMAACCLIAQAVHKDRLIWLYGAGMLLGFGGWFRSEYVAVGAAMVSALPLLFTKNLRQRIISVALFAAGTGLMLIPMFLVQRWLFQSALGLYGQQTITNWEGVLTQPATTYLGHNWVHRLSMCDWFLMRTVPDGLFSLKMSIPFVLFFLSCLSRRLIQKTLWMKFLMVLVVLASARMLYELFTAPRLETTGLLSAMPFSILVFLWCREGLFENAKKHPLAVYFFRSFLMFLFIAIFLNLGNKGGLQWGPRYILPFFPWLVIWVILAMHNHPLFRSVLVRSVVVILFCLSIIVQLVGGAEVYRSEKQYHSLVSTARLDKYVTLVTYKHRWLPHVLSGLYLSKPLFHARNSESLVELIDCMDRPFLLITRNSDNLPLAISETLQPVPSPQWFNLYCGQGDGQIEEATLENKLTHLSVSVAPHNQQP